MKKTYQIPSIEVATLMPTTIICVSITDSGKSTSEGGGGSTMYTD